MSVAALKHQDLPPVQTAGLAPPPPLRALPVLPPRAEELVPVDTGERTGAHTGERTGARTGASIGGLAARAVEAAGLEPFVRLAQVHPTLFQGALLPIAALIVMCLVMGGLPALAVGAYFVGCGMILSRKAVKTLLEQAPASGGQQPA
jgi:hypothetical protein